MKARIKETGEIVEVHTCDDADFVDRKGKYYWEHELFFGSLDEHYDNPDYWTRLEHTYAGMAMQALIIDASYAGNEGSKYLVEECIAIAHALVEKLKQKEEK